MTFWLGATDLRALGGSGRSQATFVCGIGFVHCRHGYLCDGHFDRGADLWPLCARDGRGRQYGGVAGCDPRFSHWGQCHADDVDDHDCDRDIAAARAVIGVCAVGVWHMAVDLLGVVGGRYFELFPDLFCAERDVAPGRSAKV